MDNNEGSLVCPECGLIAGAAIGDLNSICSTSEKSKMEEKAKIAALNEFGFKFQSQALKDILENWTENGLLPCYIIDLTIYRGTRFLSNYRRSECAKKHSFCSQTEFLVTILYETLIDEKIPRSVNQLASISGVSAKRLWHLIEVFYPNSGMERRLRASDWMPGLCYYLPTNFGETRRICSVADNLGEEFSFRPLTILTVVIQIFLDMRSAKHPPRKILTKKELCRITGITVSTLTRATREIFGKTSNSFWDSLRCEQDREGN